MLKLENYTRYYGIKKIFEIPHFYLHEKEMVCILGPNGAGKTTFIEGILSHNRQGNTKIYYYDQIIQGIDKHYLFLRDVAYLGHEAGLFLDLTLWENLKYFVDLYDKPFLKEKIVSWLKFWDLFHRRDDEVRTFSRGMKQRAGLLRAILQEPKILLLDEPLTGLDQKGKELLIHFLKEFKQKGSVIIVTHDDEIFGDVADRFLFLSRGKIVADLKRKEYQQKKEKILEEVYFS